jgi:hypothetical protein
MDRRPGTCARANSIRSAPVVPIGDQNMGHATPHKLLQILFTGLHRINAKISTSVTDEMAVKVITVRLGKPRPGENVFYDLSHFASLSTNRMPRVNPTSEASNTASTG